MPRLRGSVAPRPLPASSMSRPTSASRAAAGRTSMCSSPTATISNAFLDTLEARVWLAGLGWIMVAKRGALLVRSIVDTSVGLPERLVFEGPPEVVHPLRQDHAARMPEAREGELLDTQRACPPL